MLKMGDIVTHETYGMGIVVEVWGVFLSCRQCFRPVTSHGATSCCGVLPAIIGGKGIFDVEFSDGKTHSIHQRWLKRVRGTPKITHEQLEPRLSARQSAKGAARRKLAAQVVRDKPPIEDTLTRLICGLPLK